jgi:phosphatidylserine/phosphatidylglycerophosphate/cardiolipin synthase-like enzyme
MPTKRRTKARRSTRRTGGPTWVGVISLAAVLTLGYLVSAGVIDLGGLLRRAGVDPVILLGATPGPAATAELAEGEVELFFTTPELVYPDLPRDRIPPAHERALLADIETATRSIEFASFEYNLSSVAEALARAQARGVEVRLALDREGLENPVMAKWAGIVEEAGIPVSWQDGDAFLHSKFVVVDDRLVWTGSWNATINDTYRNNNNLLRITVQPIVDNYVAEFEQMAGGAFGSGKDLQTPHPLIRLDAATVENYFSPRDRVSSRVVNWVDRARQSVDVLAFAFTDDDLGDVLIERHRAGVPVRVVFEARNAEGVGSEYGRLRRNGLQVLEDGNCYTMHHKVVIIDRRVVITGSYNFTGRAEDVNDENILIIDSPVLAQAYLDEFDRVYAQAQAPLRCQ